MNSELIPIPLASPALLQGDQLSAATSDAVRELLEEAASANTTRSYSSALRYWAAWFQGRYGKPLSLPIPAGVVVQFIVDHVPRRSNGALAWELPRELDAALVAGGFKQRAGVLKLSTVIHRVSILSTAHQLRKVDNPCEQPEVRHLLARARRASHKRGERPNKKTALTADKLDALIATCDDTLEGLRDRALLYFAFASGGRRRSEVAAADFAQLTRLGARSYVYRLEYSKTQQTGPSAASSPDKPILGAAADALTAWIEASGLTEGRIFRRFNKSQLGKSLSDKSVADIVQRRARMAGLDGDFAGHSLRSGFVTEGGRQGVALPAIMAMTEHRSVASVIGYFQTGSATENPAARLMEQRRARDPEDP